MLPYKEVQQLVQRLSVAEKVDLLEQLSASLKRDLQRESSQKLPWADFVDLSYGSLADDPIERNQPPTADVRGDWKVN